MGYKRFILGPGRMNLARLIETKISGGWEDEDRLPSLLAVGEFDLTRAEWILVGTCQTKAFRIRQGSRLRFKL